MPKILKSKMTKNKTKNQSRNDIDSTYNIFILILIQINALNVHNFTNFKLL